jgi:hypothetical protein
MDKFCVFCGNKPANKNLEHVIPEWLIKLTGNFERPIKIGPVWDSKNNRLATREISFSSFAFPSCKECNDEFSKLESQVSKIVKDILLQKPISSDDFSQLFTWFDKVRIGLWLAYHYLQKNLITINPHFYIKTRINKSDRALLIYQSDFVDKRLFFTGASLPIFQYYPCCFGLVINNFFFVNISTQYLVSRGLGLPYPAKQTYTEGDMNLYEMTSGKEKITYPIINSRILWKGSRIFQLIIETGFFTSSDDFYNSDFVKNNFNFDENGIGKIFIENNSIHGDYSLYKKTDWIPSNKENDNLMLSEFSKEILKYQISMVNNIAYGQIPEDKRSEIKRQNELVKKINRELLAKLDAWVVQKWHG